MPDSVKPVTSFLKSPSISTINKPNLPTAPYYSQLKDPVFDLKDITVEELAKAANVSEDVIKHAIYVREQHMKAEHRAMLAARLREEYMKSSTPTSTFSISTTSNPVTRPSLSHNKDPNLYYSTPAKTIANNNSPFATNSASLDNSLAIKVFSNYFKWLTEN